MAHISDSTWKLIESTVENGTLDDVKDLYQSNNLKYIDFGGDYENRRNLLFVACEKGKLEIVKFCIKEMKMWELYNSQQQRYELRGYMNPMTTFNQEVQVIDFNNALVMNPLILAVKEGHLEVVKFLMKNGARLEIESQTFGLETMFSWAISHEDILYYLLGVREDMFSVDFNKEKVASVIHCQSEKSVIKYLVDEGLKSELREEYINESLVRYSEWGLFEVVKYLIREDANVYHENKDGITALDAALKNKRVKIVEYIFNCMNAQVRQSRYDNGLKLLMWAIQKGEIDIVTCFIDREEDLRFMDAEGKSARQLLSTSPVSDHRLDFVRFVLHEQTVVSYKVIDAVSYCFDKLVEDNELKAETIVELNEKMGKKFATIIENVPNFASDPSKMLIFHRGNYHINLVELYLSTEKQEVSFRAKILKVVFVALQAKIHCNGQNVSRAQTSGQKDDKNYDGKKVKSLKQLLGHGKLFNNFVEEIKKSTDNVKGREGNFWNGDGDKNNLSLIHMNLKLHNEYIKIDKGCAKTIKDKVSSYWRKTLECISSCWGKVCCKQINECKLPRLSHNCKERGNFALISCFLAIWVYMLDLITDFTVGYEDYNGFSKKLGIFEMILVVFTLMHENIRSSISLYSTEEELLRIKLGKQDIEMTDWDESELYKSHDNPIKQLLFMLFWPFTIRKKDDFLKRLKAVIYNILTIFQLRPVVDRLRVLIHSPTNLRVLYRHRAEQDSLKQFYLITEQIPELLIQFYTLQIVFNIAGGGQSGNKPIFSDCESGHNFSYPRFTDSLNNPDEKNWFCNDLPIDSLTCDIFFRLFSAMIPFFMIPSGIVSLEVDFRLLDPATPKMSTVVQYLLQAAYTLMVPARLLMFAALMHAIPKKEIIFGFIILRATLEFGYNTLAWWKIAKRPRLVVIRKVWKTMMFGVRDVFAVSIREPVAYMKSPSEVTYDSIRNWRVIIVRCFIFLLEGVIGAHLIEEFYPCGSHSEIFRYIGWMCLASLILSVTLMTVISDLLHPQHIFNDRNSALKSSINSAGVTMSIGFVSSLVFILTKQRSSAEMWVLLGIIFFVVISGVIIVVIKHFTFVGELKQGTNKDNSKGGSCCFGMCCPGPKNSYEQIPEKESSKEPVPERKSSDEIGHKQNFPPESENGKETFELTDVSPNPASSAEYENPQC